LKYVRVKNRDDTFVFGDEVLKSGWGKKTQDGTIKKVADNYQLKENEEFYRFPRILRKSNR